MFNIYYGFICSTMIIICQYNDIVVYFLMASTILLFANFAMYNMGTT